MMGIIMSGNWELTAQILSKRKVSNKHLDKIIGIDLAVGKDRTVNTIVVNGIRRSYFKDKTIGTEKYLKRCRNRDKLYKKRLGKYGKR